MAFTDAASTDPTPIAPNSPHTYSAPSRSDLVAVAATVSVVGILMAVLVTWLILRLRRASQSQSDSTPLSARRISTASYIFRPSFAPSEASSKFGFIRKPLRLSHRQNNSGSWDFADPDPFSPSKQCPLEHVPSQKRRPPPLAPAPAYMSPSRRTSTYKDEFGPRTPSTPGTPASVDYVEPPPPAYCTDSTSWPLYHPKDL